MGNLLAAASALGALQRLNNRDGTWRCWRCDTETTFRASLHCEWCEHEGAARGRASEARERALNDEDYRWRGMVRNMVRDSRLDRDGGVRLLAAARQLQSATTERVQRLSQAFDKRFDRAQTQGYVVEYPDPAEGWDRG